MSTVPSAGLISRTHNILYEFALTLYQTRRTAPYLATKLRRGGPLRDNISKPLSVNVPRPDKPGQARLGQARQAS